ncbi:MAG: XrtA system polysaccharide deacetylase [Terriglobia bacterium]
MLIQSPTTDTRIKATTVSDSHSRAQIGKVSAKCIFTVDVEDWFHILDVPSTPPMSAWDSLPSRVEKNFLKLLDIFGEKNVRVTCFFLGWVAEKFPHLVREAQARGHEIASHGYAHRLVYQMSREDFLADVTRSKKLLEDVAGSTILGYRSAGFSVTEKTPWFFEELIRSGYAYDSSVFPGPREHGGIKNGMFAPYVITNGGRTLIEFPITVSHALGRPLCFFGGGYLRLFPYRLIQRMTRKVLKQGRPVIFYVHPREIDTEHPRLAMGLGRRFKSYVGLHTTTQKLRRLTGEFEHTTFRDFITAHADALRAA